MTRDETGRFVKGHPGTGGRKKRQIEESYLKIFRNSVSESDWKAIIYKAVEQAKRGDNVARKFIADYLIGVPVQKIDAKIAGDILINWDEVDNANDD